jgi:hypothetical protein
MDTNVSEEHIVSVMSVEASRLRLRLGYIDILQERPPVIYGRQEKEPGQPFLQGAYLIQPHTHPGHLDPEEGSSIFLRIVDVHLQVYVVVRAEKVTI